MRERILVPVAVAILVMAWTGAASGQGGRASVSPFDGGQPLLRALPNVLPAVPLNLGADLSIYGVSSSELSTVGPLASGDQTANLIVDDDKMDCPNAKFTTIQSAVNAASAGARIRVCRGTYVEQVTIPSGRDGLLLFGSPDLAAVIKAPSVMLEPKAIVRVNGARNVTIRHFTITGPGSAPCDTIRYGVRIDGGGSALIESNRITQIQNILLGCGSEVGFGVGVLVGREFEGEVGTAEISHNLIDRYEKGGVVIDNAGSYGNVHHNQITGPGIQSAVAPNGIQVSRGASGNVHHNVVTENSFSDFLFLTGTGILILDGAPNAVTVGYNKVFLNDDGISLFTTDGALIEHNHSYDQRVFDGLYAFTDTRNNLFSHNHAEGNTEHDCHDDSLGAGTAGTANFWDKNLGQTENRPGLCKAKPK
jgi:parallel beta helix pectate lyase-like protein